MNLSTLSLKLKLNEDHHGNGFNPFYTPFLSILYDQSNEENMNSHLSSSVPTIKLGEILTTIPAKSSWDT